MAHTILMPRLGWTMEEGIFGAWLKADGEHVAEGDLLFTVESDKATQEVESFEAGILRIPPTAPAPGAIVPVGALLGYLLQEGEESPLTQATHAPAASAPPIVTPTTEAGRSVADVAAREPGERVASLPTISPRARRVATELNIDWTGLQGSGRTGRIVERDVRAAAVPLAVARSETGVRATPVAQRVASDAGIDLATVRPRSPGARIQRSDVEAAIRAQGAAENDPPSAVESVNDAGLTMPVSRVRHLIAQRMLDSAQSTAAVTLTSEADATELVNLRQDIRAIFEPRDREAPSYNDLLIKLTALALQQHPMLNATWQEETIQLWNDVHIGLAVDAADGLVVPVVRDVLTLPVGQITIATRDLIARAQTRQLRPDELQGGTFTITNLGMYGIDAFTPIIALPQSAILGVGRIQSRPAVVNDQVVPRMLVVLSLTFDHRVVDGGQATRFLNTIREFVEEPTLWMFD